MPYYVTTKYGKKPIRNVYPGDCYYETKEEAEGFKELLETYNSAKEYRIRFAD